MLLILSITIVISAILIRHWWFWSPLDTSRLYKGNSPLFIGHRGMLNLAPENTLSSFQAALDVGFPSIEMDVVPTKDEQIVCSHNFDLERESDGKGWIDKILFNNLSGVNTGIYSHPDNLVSFIKLCDVCDQLPEGIIINIEIKSRGILHIRHAFSVARMIKSQKIKQQVIVSSFNPFIIWAIKLIDRNILTALILEKMTFFWTINLVHPDLLHPDAELVDDQFMSFCAKNNLAVNVWTVNTIPAMQWLLKKGVSGIITNNPNAIKVFYET